MKTEVKNIDKTRQEIQVVIDWSDIAGDFSEFLKKFARDVQIPGFRKGKVPVSRVEKMYGRKLELEFFNDKFYEFYGNAIRETKAKPVSDPSISKLDMKRDEKIDFTVEFDIIPDWNMPALDSSIVVESDKFVVDDKNIDEYLEGLRKQHAEVQPAEAAEMGSHLTAKIEELDDAGEALPDRTIPEGRIVLGEAPIDGDNAEALVGISCGESREITLTDVSDEGNKRHYKITPSVIERHILPELNDELVQTVDADMESLEQYREKVRSDMQDYWNTESDKALQMAIIEKLVGLVPDLSVPESMVNSYLDDLRADNEKEQNTHIDAEKYREANYPEGEKRLKWQFIANEIKEAAGISATEDDINAHVESIVSKVGEQNRDNFRNYYLQTPHVLDNIRYQVENDKIFAHIRERITVNYKESGING